MGGELSTSS